VGGAPGLSLAITRYLALALDYSYYHYSFNPEVVLLDGVAAIAT
jgi:hypothetical protein